MRGPTRLTPELTEAICADIRAGCYAKVAGTRHGVSSFTLYQWSKRGESEAEARERAEDDREPTIYEAFWRELEAAKAEARYDAELRVFKTQPSWWLARGYAREDWRRSDQLVRVIEDLVEQRVNALLGQPQQQPTAQDLRTQQVVQRLHAIFGLDDPERRKRMDEWAEADAEQERGKRDG